METLAELLLTNLGLKDEPNMLQKTLELLRLLNLRAANVPLQINEYGKIILCVDIAASLVGIPIDKELALKYSGLRKSHYSNNKRMFEKMFDLIKCSNNLANVNDICIKLNLNHHVNEKAEEILGLYRQVMKNEQATDVDGNHPQYAAMAVFIACKICKQKVSKSKLIPFSNLKPAQWLLLEKRFEKFIDKHYRNDNKVHDDIKSKLQNSGKLLAADTDIPTPLSSGMREKNADILEYAKWKQQMLAIAHAGLLESERNSRHEENTRNPQDVEFFDIIDNMVLGH